MKIRGTGHLPVLTTPAGGSPGQPAPAPPGTDPTPSPTPAPTPQPQPQPAPLPHRLGVAEGEWYLRPSYDPVAAGKVEFNVHDYGMDAHDLTVARDGVVVGQVAVVSRGDAVLKVDLAPGTYRLYCSLEEGLHDQKGMHASLTVK